jgi:hypothetical protein
LLSIKDDPLLF